VRRKNTLLRPITEVRASQACKVRFSREQLSVPVKTITLVRDQNGSAQLLKVTAERLQHGAFAVKVQRLDCIIIIIINVIVVLSYLDSKLVRSVNIFVVNTLGLRHTRLFSLVVDTAERFVDNIAIVVCVVVIWLRNLCKPCLSRVYVTRTP